MTSRRRLVLGTTLVILSLVASADGIRNGFTYDDQYIVFMNSQVHTLKGWWHLFANTYWPPVWGGDGYRPLTILAFALEWAAGRGAPWVFHAVNIALYCATTLTVFWLALALLPELAAWVTAALFAVHPVHVEAVANTVGQAELSAGLVLIWSTAFYIHRRRRGELGRGDLAILFTTYVLTLFAKEHAIVLPAMLLAAEVTVIGDPRPLRERLIAFRLLGLLLTLGAAGYLLARSLVVVGGLAGFAPYVVFQSLNLSYANRVLTMLGVVPEWIRLFLWPARLMTEYAPPYIDIAQGPALRQLPGFLILGGTLGLAAALYRRRPLVTFAIAWICITLLPVSNFVVAAGIILAERTLFLPSVGAVLAVGSVVAWLQPQLSRPRSRLAGATALAGLLAAGAWRSFDRTLVWHDNERLFRQAVIDAPLAYRSHYMLGAWLFERKRKREGEHEYRRALHLFPYDPYMSYNLAEQYRAQGMCFAALPLYKWSFELRPDLPAGHGPYAICLLLQEHFAEAKEQAFIGMGREGHRKEYLGIVAAADSAIVHTGRTGPAATTVDVVPAGHPVETRAPLQPGT